MDHFREELEARWQREGGSGYFDDWLRNSDEWHSGASDYSNLFERYEPSKRRRAEYIEDLVSGVTPKNGYLFLSQLLAQGYLDTVVTTNFDDLVYEACARWTSVRPRVYFLGEPAGHSARQVGRASVLKLHGDYLYSRFNNLDAEVDALDLNMKKRVTDLMSAYDIIVIGYSGKDNSIMEIFDAVPVDTDVFWCTYNDEPLSGKAQRLLREQKNWYRVRTNGFESLMGYFLHTVNFVFPDVERTYWEQKAGTITTIMESGSPYRQDFLGTAAEATNVEPERTADDVRVWVQAFLAGFAAYHKGDSSGAIAPLRRAHMLRPRDAFTRAFLGFALSRSGQGEEAIRILGDTRNDPDLLSAFGLALTETGRAPEAIALLRPALTRFPESIEVLLSLTRAQVKSGFLADAIELLRPAQTRDPDNVQVLIALSDGLARVGRQAEATALMRPAWERCKDNPVFVGTLGFALWQLGYVDETIALLRKALTDLPGNPDVLSNLGSLLTRNDRVEEGIEILREAQRLFPRNADVLCALGFALLQDGQASEAIAVLHQALEHHPDNEEVVLADLGLALFGAGKRDEAEQAFQRILRITSDKSSNDLGRLCWRGVALLATGRLDHARELFGSLIERDPQPLTDFRDVMVSLRHLEQLGVAGAQQCVSMIGDAVRR
jgi:Flp pilus assembly protein TadD